MGGAREALVVGAGVVGLTAAIRLAEAGWRVRVWAAAPPERTTSAVAAAIWYPFRAYPADRVAAWGAATYAELVRIAEREPASGVRMRSGVELWRREVPTPEWADAVPSLRRLDAAELPAGYRDGLTLTVPVADTAVYLGYLLRRLAAAGGSVEWRRAESLGEALAACPRVVHCAGLAARELADDPSVFPIRGQIVRVENPGLERWVLDEDDPRGMSYIVPRTSDCVLGGTADEGAWDTEPDPAVAAAIVARCVEIEPRLAGARVLEHRVGLRPGRPAVRVEGERRDGGVVVHDYGHGGSGVTLAWGCADEVVRLLAAAG